MKSQIFPKYFFALCFSLLVAFTVNSQVTWDTFPYKTYADFKLQNLDKTIITSGILYDRVFPVADIERFRQQDQFTDTTGPRHRVQSCYESYNAAYNATNSLFEEIEHPCLVCQGTTDYTFPINDYSARTTVKGYMVEQPGK